MNAPATTIQFDPEVHPSAALFPMLPPDELQELADSIAANGLQQPIVMQGDVLIDGRNRLAACRLAGVEPLLVQHDGDADAFILGANINRRHMTKGQRAMAVAMVYPEPNARGKKSVINTDFNSGTISHARTVLKWAPELADGVLAGAEPLDASYRVASERKAAADVPEARLAQLRATDPDLADKVGEGILKLEEARLLAKDRREKARTNRQGTYDCLASIERLTFLLKGAHLDDLVATCRDFPDELPAERVRKSLVDWISIFSNAKEALNDL